MRIRNVITGHDAHGKAVVVNDQLVDGLQLDLMPGFEFHMLWSSARLPNFPDNGQPQPSPSYFPPPGGARFLVFTIPGERLPPSAEIDIDEAESQADYLLPGLLSVMEKSNPGMHRSETIDFVYVLEGEIILELDGGNETVLSAGQSVVQNGTRHAWRNRSGKNCRLLVCMVGAESATSV